MPSEVTQIIGPAAASAAARPQAAQAVEAVIATPIVDPRAAEAVTRKNVKRAVTKAAPDGVQVPKRSEPNFPIYDESGHKENPDKPEPEAKRVSVKA